ncbi:hypothetical protein NDU88_003534 [Pleurodeles waltl]|uniref:Uncharacterized protein n=1 Tax=Pleurodeles waltl TaxID=8319 RepID=A0AAV7SDT1_PLEWA|nr:hypothetical protein NDU88_003534 [Pleurodeles waltl]
MIRQLIDIAQEEYETYRNEVDTLNKQIDKAKWVDITINNYNVIDQYEEDIIQRKNRKFRRDLTDYKLGRVYNFGKKYDNIKPPNSTKKRSEIERTVLEAILFISN